MTLLNLANLLRLEPTWPRRYIHAMWETAAGRLYYIYLHQAVASQESIQPRISYLEQAKAKHSPSD